jgi:phage FluMu protein Com
MPAELLKFRCYRCNQLLAVAATRAGTVVACPRCKADLQIPGADAESKAEGGKGGRRERGGTAASISLSNAAIPLSDAETSLSNPAVPKSNEPEVPGFLTEIAAAIPPEVAELRPEDLRVEAEVFQSITREAIPPPPPSISPSVVEVPPPFPVLDSKLKPMPELSNLFAPAPQPIAPSPAPDTGSAATGESRAFVPPIEIEPPSVRAAGVVTRRPHEVILPASVVLVCEIFALVGLAFSFIAGLMIGHFLWKVH